MSVYCEYCGLRMSTGKGCTVTHVTVHGIRQPRVAYGYETRFSQQGHMLPCHDCGAQVGYMHHPGCDMEECPQCGQQMHGAPLTIFDDPIIVDIVAALDAFSVKIRELAERIEAEAK